MLPKVHIIVGGIISILLYLLFPITILEVSLIFLSSFLIDFDHYLLYVVNKKDFSLKKSFRWFIDNQKKFKH